jgi:hypothetical protein
VCHVSNSSNRAYATCPTVAKVHNVRVPVTDVGASSNRACATCPTVATDEARLLLLGHHRGDGTTAASHLPVATEGYRSLIQWRIVVVGVGLKQLIASCVGSWPSGFLCREGLWQGPRRVRHGICCVTCMSSSIYAFIGWVGAHSMWVMSSHLGQMQ